MATAEISDEAPVIALSPERIAQDRAAAERRPLPDSPMEAASDEIILPPSEGFNSMSSKLEKLMNEIGKKESKVPEPDSSPKESITTNSKKKPEESAETKNTEKAEEIENKTITSAKAADWKALKDKLKAEQAAKAELEQKHILTTKEYEEYKKKAVDASQVEAVRKELEAANAERQKWKEQIEVVALERSPEFTNFYNSKLTDATTKAKDAVGAEKAERIEQLMALAPSKWRKEKINEIRDELTGVDQGQLDIAIAKYDEARADREDKLKNSKENYQRLTQLEVEKANAQRADADKRSEAAMAAVLSLAREKFDSFKPTDDKENATHVAESEEFVQRFFKRKMTDTEVALLPVYAMEHKRLSERVVPTLSKRVAELEAALKEYQGSNPSPEGGKPAVTTGKEGGGDFISAFTKAWPGNK